MSQLDIYGGEHETTDTMRAPTFTDAQREILRTIRVHGLITSTAAGRILHAHREPSCPHCSMGSCSWAASDGGDALKRLRDRGLVRRIRTGVWGTV